MEYSYSNLQIRSSDSAAVRLAIDLCDIGSAKMLARADLGWISVYPFLTEDDYGYLKQVAEKMGRRLEVPILAVLCVGGGAFQYALLDQRGVVVDQFSSSPPDATAGATGGNPDLLLPLCLPRTKKSALKELLRPAPPGHDSSRIPHGDRVAQGLAQVLGIPRAQMCVGFNHLKWAQAGR